MNVEQSQPTKVTTSDAPRPSGAYSQAVVANGFVYAAGQAPRDPETRAIVGSDIATQTRATLSNLRAVLEAAGSSFENVIKTTVHLADLNDFADFDAEYRKAFPTALPARTTVQSGLPGILVEIDAVAVVRS